jgi:hypothetical protein
MNKTVTRSLESAATALTSASKEIGRLPSRLDVATRALERFAVKGIRYAKRHPLGSLVAAFAAGVVTTSLARRT